MAFHFNVMVLDELERREQMRNVRIQHRILRDNSNPFDLPEKNFKKLFRLSKFTARFLIDELLPHMQEEQRVSSVPNHLKVLLTLSFLGKGSYQLDVGQNYLLGLSQPSVSKCMSVVITQICQILLNTWIKFPMTNVRKQRIKQRFMDKFQFPNVIGAIDCTHVAIVAPPATDPQYPARVYYNRKRYTSINTQIICDSDLKILSINPRFPGSTHDSAIWATSNIKNVLENNFLNGDERTYLLGDSGYPLQPWLLTPVEGAAEDTPEAVYNRRHKTVRNCIERLNGALKSRFRCLLRHRVLHYHPVKAAHIIYACAVLHNITVHFNDAVPDDDENLEDDNDDDGPDFHVNVNNNWFNEGQRIRRNFINNWFNI